LLKSPKETYIHTYALLDSRSQATLILKKFADEVGLEGTNEMLTLGTIDSKEVSKPSRKVSFSVKAASDDSAATSILIPEAWTVPQLNLPKQKITHSVMQTWPHVADLEIQDVDSEYVTVLVPTC